MFDGDEYLSIQQAYERAFALHVAKNFDEAERIYKSILEIQPNHREVRFQLGRMAEEKEDTEAAVRYYGEAVNLDPNNTNYQLYLGRLLNPDTPDRSRFHPPWTPILI